MSTSETPPPLFLLPPCLLSSSSLLPLAKAGAAPNPSASAPPPSSFADPVKKPRREVSDLPSFSPRCVRSLMYSLSFSRMAKVLATSVHRWSFALSCNPPSASRAYKEPATTGQREPPWLPVAPPAPSAPDAHGIRDRVQSLSMGYTNVGVAPDHSPCQ